MNAIIQAAGPGTRLRPLTDMVPKCLMPLNGHPLMDYWIAELKRLRIQTIGVTIHHLPLQFEAYITIYNAKRAGRGPKLVGLRETTLLGNAGSLTEQRAFAQTSDEFLCVFGDNLCQANLRNMIQYHRQEIDCDILTMALFESSTPEACGVAQLNTYGTVIDFEEKPAVPKSNLVSAGIFAFSRRLFLEIADMRVKDWGHDVLPQLVAQNRVRGWVCDGPYIDIGTPENYAKAEVMARQRPLKSL